MDQHPGPLKSIVLWLRRFSLVAGCAGLLGSANASSAFAETNQVRVSSAAELTRELVNAALEGANDRIALLLTNALDINARVGPGLTAWQAARIKGRVDTMEVLAKREADTNAAWPGKVEIVDWFVRERVPAGSPGLALAVVRDGGVVFQRGWGMSNLEYDISITPSTIFHVASVSKQFTAFAIGLLAQRGKLSLDDDIRTYLPDMPDFGKKITLRHLLYHTSGLRNQWKLLIQAGWRMEDVITQEDVMGLLRRQRELDFSPGETQAYSNSGYTLLSEIVAKVTGRTFADFAAEEIFRPLGMTNTHFHTNHQTIVRNMAYSYYPAEVGTYRKSMLNFDTVGPTGLFTTAEDLAKWIANFQDPKVGGASLLAQMQETGKLNNGMDADYGFGLFLEKYRGSKLVQHGGADAGYRSFVLWFPEHRLGVSLVSNLGSINNREIALTIAEIYLGDKLAPVKPTRSGESAAPITLSPASLDLYTGTYYQDSWGHITEISRVGTNLESRLNNEPAQALIPLGNHKFVAGEEWLLFENLDSGAAGQFTNRWGDLFKRLPGPVETQPDLKPYVGEYWSDELEVDVKVRFKDDHLILGLRRNGEFPLRYLARNSFVHGSSWWLSVSFRRNPEDAVVGLRLNGLQFNRRSTKPRGEP